MTTKTEPRGIEPASELAGRLGMDFSRPYLLVRALTHRSYVNEHPETLIDNERLEFLGDAVLDFIVGAWVYRHFPEMPEGDLTKVRSALVCNERLALFARKFEIGRAIRLGRGELTSGGRHRDALLGSTFEALVGAYYLEAGIQKVEEWVIPLLESVRETVMDELQDPKSQFQERTQAERLGTPHYRVTGTSGPDHSKIFEVEVAIGERIFGSGKGPSKQAAERAAAADALEKL